MAGARVGALGGDPALVRACLQVKIAAVRLNTNRVAQVGAAAALRDEAWIRRGEDVIRRNLAALKAIATPVIDPAYGFSCVVDVSGTGASAQELTVALCRRRVAVYPGDGLGEVGATTTIRLNLSDPDPSALERLAAAWPGAVEEAASGAYREAVRDLFLSYGTDRGRRIAALVEAGS
jgi:aspartate/methionine/tyrosine aminotransferase